MRGRRRTWVEDLGLEDVGRGDAGTRGSEDVGRKKAGTRDVGTGGRDNQATPNFCAEFV